MSVKNVYWFSYVRRLCMYLGMQVGEVSSIHPAGLLDLVDYDTGGDELTS